MLLIDFKILGVEIKMLSQGKSANRFLNYRWLSGLGTEVSNLRLEEFKKMDYFCYHDLPERAKRMVKINKRVNRSGTKICKTKKATRTLKFTKEGRRIMIL